mgnify:FL=1
MERLIVLGTGNAQAIHCYNTCYAMQKGEEYFLVDAGGGNGILSQLDKAGIPLESIHNIFVTHAHNDHILGMVWMIRMIATSMNKGTYDGTLTIYCHEELVHTIKTLTKLTVGKKFYKHFDERIVFHVIAHGDTIQIYKKINGKYTKVWKYDNEIDFAHALVGTKLAGQNAFVCGVRRKDCELFAVTYEDGEYKVTMIEKGVGPANLCVVNEKDRDIIVAANHTANEAAVYFVTE